MSNNIELPDYIEKYYKGNQRAYANANDIKPPQVSLTVNHGGYFVDDKGYLCIRRRKLADVDVSLLEE